MKNVFLDPEEFTVYLFTLKSFGDEYHLLELT